MNRTLELHTPEGLGISLPLAGVGSRFAAWLVDWLCSIALAVALAQVSGLFIVFGADTVLAARLLSYFFSNLAYGIASEWLLDGQSVGKRLFGLRVIDAGGRELRFAQVALRNLLRFLDMLPAAYALGCVCALFSKNGQRLGDVLANTAVVAARPRALPLLEPLPRPEWNALRNDTLLVLRLRRALGVEFALLAFDVILRRDELAAEARALLFRELAATIRSTVSLPAEFTLELSDERLVRNVVDALCASTRDSAGTAKGLSVRPRRATLPVLQGTASR